MADQHKSSAVSVAECEDLLTDILLRLPAKSLIRFQCVTKYWHSFIFDTEFQQKHCSAHKINSSISGLYFFHKPRSSIHAVSLTTKGIPPSLHFLGSTNVRLQHHSNGLLLGWYNDMEFFFVCNPTTRSYSMVAIPEEIGHYRDLSSYLAYDPCSLSMYKVVTVSIEDPDCVFYVYSSDTASWKKIVVDDSAFMIRKPIKTKHAIFFKGSLYWIDDVGNMRRFHMDSEDLTVIGCPLGKIKYFGECRGSLIAIKHTYREGDYWFDIFEMDSSDCSQWTKKSSIKLRWDFEDEFTRGTVMCVSKFASGGDLQLILSIPGKVVSYTRKNQRRRNNKRKLKVLSVHPAIGTNYRPVEFNFSVYPFVETLAAV